MGPAAGKAKDSDGERIATLEGKIQGLATASQVARIETAVQNLADLNSKQHTDMADRLFGPSPTSLQSQITAIKESTIGDSPLSLRSRQTETDKKLQFGKALWAALVFFIGGAMTFFAIQFKTVAAWFGYKSVLPMILYDKLVKFDVLLGHCWSAGTTVIASCWPRALWMLRKFWS